MRQALHILRKDSRRFAYEICVLVALTIAFAWSQIVNDVYTAGALSDYLRLAGAVLPIAWWYVISLLIHEESLIGDRQFWVTRPYSRGRLFAAKALFVVLFMNVPLLLAGFVILAAAGFQPLAYLPNFFWMQLVLVATLILPPLALASLTRTLVQFALTILGTLACFIVLTLVIGGVQSSIHQVYQSKGLAWAGGLASSLLLVAPALLILLLQWATRRRWVAVGAGIALFLLLDLTQSSLSWRLGTAVQSRMFGERGAESTTVTLNAGDVTPDSWAETHEGVALAVGFRVIHIPAGETAAPQIIEMTFEDRSGARWSTGWTHVISSEADVFQKDPAQDRTFNWWQRVVMDRSFYQRARSGPVKIRGSVYVMLNARRGFGLPENRTTAVPGGGVCTVWKPRPQFGQFVKCLAPFHPPFSATDNIWNSVYFWNSFPRPRSSGRLLSMWDSPLPAEFGMSPLSTMSAGNYAGFIFLRYEPRAYVLRSFQVANARLP
ncbi:MAG: hypothetical protein ABSH47_02950 [Bryobacteraceae bacterium]|jgi:hypothetical protein